MSESRKRAIIPQPCSAVTAERPSLALARGGIGAEDLAISFVTADKIPSRPTRLMESLPNFVRIMRGSSEGVPVTLVLGSFRLCRCQPVTIDRGETFVILWRGAGRPDVCAHVIRVNARCSAVQISNLNNAARNYHPRQAGRSIVATVP
jgi:hypothetical protein